MSRFLSVVRKFNWLLVLLVAPLLLFPKPGNPWTLALVPLILLLQALAWRCILPATPFNSGILLLLIATLASLYATTDLADSFPKITGLLFGILIFFTIIQYGKSENGWKKGLLVFCLLGLGIAGFSLVSTRWVIVKFPALDALTAMLPVRLTGLEGATEGFQPNEVAGALLWVFPVIIGIALANLSSQENGIHRYKPLLWQTAYILASFFILAVLFLTQSRGAYVGLAFACILAFVLAFPPHIRRLGLGLLFLAVIIGISLITITGWQNISGRVFGTDTSLSTTQGLLDTITLREQIWSRAIWGLKDFGLLGMGLNRFRTIFQQLYPSFLIPFDRDIAHAHNELLNAGVELGYLGLIAFLSLNFTAAAMLWQILQRADREGENGKSLRWLALGLGAAWLSHFIYGLTDAIALGARPDFLFWFLLALISSLYQISSEKIPIAT